MKNIATDYTESAAANTEEAQTFREVKKRKNETAGYLLSNSKRGLKVNQAMAGKKIIGTASPGKSSGFLISSGSEMEIGRIIAAKEATERSI